MSTTTTTKTVIPEGIDARVLTRILEEGYGPGAWHGADLRAALEDVPAEHAFWRPAPGRHSIAEIALHHAYCTRSVRAQLAGTEPAPFVLDGEDWFPLDDQARLPWTRIRAALDAEERGLATLVTDIAAGRVQAGVPERERFDLVLGITCHAIYHAGQVQLIKRLRSV